MKKTVCGLLAAALVFCGAGAQVYGASENASAVGLLSAMGVITPDSGGSYNLDRFATRAEFTKMLIMASPYKDSVSTAPYSVFKDMPTSHWAAPYIRLAVTNGLLSGYSDGLFRPDSTVTLEQAANSVLKLLGYAESDFRGAFPDAQMNMFKNSSLSVGVSGVVGAVVTRMDAVNIIYNMLNSNIKDGSKKYAETIGYSMNANGEVDYAVALSKNMNGPFTVKNSSWDSELGLEELSFAVYKNGKAAEPSDVKLYDVIYYNQSKTVIWVYDKKVTGVYEKASPSQNDVTAVTVSGKEYTLESSNAFSALSSSGTLRVGNTITLLIGRNGGVADAVSGTTVNTATAMYITELGSKTYLNTNDQEYLSKFIRGVSAAGDEIESPTTQIWPKIGDIVKVDFSGGENKIEKISPAMTISGEGDASLYKIGGTQLAEDVRIIDTDRGAYTTVSIQRLGGVRISAADVLYQEVSNGKVTSMILDDVTGDCGNYGIIVNATTSTTREEGISGGYTYLLNGVLHSLATQDSSFKISAGPALIKLSGESVESMSNLSKITNKIRSISETEAVCDGTVEKWPVSSKIGVYAISSSNQYVQATMADAIAAFKADSNVSCYYDAEPKNGGQIRIIVIGR